MCKQEGDAARRSVCGSGVATVIAGSRVKAENRSGREGLEKSVALVTSLPATGTTTTASPSPTSFSPSTGWVPPEPGSADEAPPFSHCGRENATEFLVTICELDKEEGKV